jgi:ABC-type multidrug transport system fused ATPase/permease subunit
MLALGAVVVFGGIYGGLFMLTRRWASRSGKAHQEANVQRFKIATDALQGAKEIKLYRLEDAVIDRFEKATVEASANASNQNLLAQLPRYALETVAFGAMLVMMLYLLETHHSLQGALPVLGLYIFASMRLLPALQAVFGAFNAVRYNGTVVAQLAAEFEQAPPVVKDTRASRPLPFENAIRLEKVGFSYARSTRPVLDGLSLNIRSGEWVSFVGPTGSGKSTLVDLMLGLLEPGSGQITIDGAPLTPDRHRDWQAQTAYVPQQIFLVNDTVEANICFGIAPEGVDRTLMEKAARIAQIHDFIVEELGQGYQSVVGDRGIRLSGGQRQRIGVARALYRWPRFLVLDEATSALDGATEGAFFRALREELSHCTVVSVTHRLATTRNFDHVYRLQAGAIVDDVRPEDRVFDEAAGASS